MYVIQPDARELLPGGSNETAGALCPGFFCLNKQCSQQLQLPAQRRDLLESPIDLAGRLARRRATLVLGGRGVPTLPSSDGLLPLRSMAELAAFARGVGTGR